MLFVSRAVLKSGLDTRHDGFQSRNREAFRFKREPSFEKLICSSLFQSRNRDAFRFKSISAMFMNFYVFLFQSRNREAFRFKLRTS